MIHVVQVLIALLIIFSVSPEPSADFELRDTLAVSFGVFGGVILAVLAVSQSALGTLRRDRELIASGMESLSEFGPDGRGHIASLKDKLGQKHARIHHLMSQAFDLIVLLGLFIILSRGHLAWALTDQLGLSPDLLAIPGLAIYLTMQIVAWWAHARYSIQYKNKKASPWESVSFSLKLVLFSILPLVLLWIGMFAFKQIPLIGDAMASFEVLELFLPIALLGLLIYLAPLAMRFFFQSTQIREGELHDRLQLVAKRCGQNVDRIYLWKIGRMGIPTAFMIGLARPFRYVFISDALINRLNPDEIDAVFAHELGHAKYKHLWILLAFLIGLTFINLALFLLLNTLFPDFSTTALENVDSTLPSIVSVAVLLVGIFFGFGYLMRRLERQADFFSATHTHPVSLANALHQLSLMMGGSHARKGWRHFSIERRITELSIKFGSRESEPRREKFVAQWEGERRWFLGSFFLLVLISMGSLAPIFAQDVKAGHAAYPRNVALRLIHTHGAEGFDETLNNRIDELYGKSSERYVALADDADDEQDLAIRVELVFNEILKKGYSAEEDSILDEISASRKWSDYRAMTARRFDNARSIYARRYSRE